VPVRRRQAAGAHFAASCRRMKITAIRLWQVQGELAHEGSFWEERW
jgi:hypothetical protein